MHHALIQPIEERTFAGLYTTTLSSSFRSSAPVATQKCQDLSSLKQAAAAAAAPAALDVPAVAPVAAPAADPVAPVALAAAAAAKRRRLLLE